MSALATILIVDDDWGVQTGVQRALTRTGHEVLTAGDGVEALSILQAKGESILVVVLDVVMPGMNGLAVVRHLLNVHRHIVGIVPVSAHADAIHSPQEFLALGTDLIVTTEVLAKPVEFPTLLLEIERVIRLVREKRAASDRSTIASLRDRLEAIEARMATIDRRIPSFPAQLGLDLIRALVLGLAILLMLFTGLDDFLRRVLGM